MNIAVASVGRVMPIPGLAKLSVANTMVVSLLLWLVFSVFVFYIWEKSVDYLAEQFSPEAPDARPYVWCPIMALFLLPVTVPAYLCGQMTSLLEIVVEMFGPQAKATKRYKARGRNDSSD